MKTIEAKTKCPCGAELSVHVPFPKALSQRSNAVECNDCASKFLATVKRKASAGKVTFDVIELTEKACMALKEKAALDGQAVS